MNITSDDIKNKVSDSREKLKYSQISELHKKYFIINDKNYNYCNINLCQTDLSEIKQIVDECRGIEEKNWNPRVDFYRYVQNCDTLTYIETDNKIVAFALSTFLPKGRFCIYSGDEAMVLKEHQGKQILRKMTLVITRIFNLRLSRMGSTRPVRVAYLSLTSNPGLISRGYKNRWVLALVPNTFRPSKNLVDLHDHYLKTNEFQLVDEKCPFFVKEVFPECHRNKNDKWNLQFTGDITKKLPQDFDCIHRGDALLYAAMLGKYTTWLLLTGHMIKDFGRNFIFNINIGLFKKNENILTGIDSIDRREKDRRKAERRITDRRVSYDEIEDKSFVERRIFDRRETA